ncbi:MAG: thioredoxin peroxidase [Candidatus Andersenbacteria bacterium RIFCSPHIGHO2_02_FULL_45_11]|uniref:Thioredoxin peroxidase n=1 Tax=Candidatus Andersenbacteria bacterium RIFCSPHIGHO2_12_FULL_45_11 TaxID=1797281 RepID=A0A1G1X0A5_9BACT|nr:MAG: thioredoxin peroxidase [Candidatus Andersenbacteria bacterium RIFCSPHIGHO2_02_FULL_45_11]OGY33445.1 MAG: thioredoxin peroxidase [Candidatus Andersenbacteria bacterium RIFCSPHIGHO2_12_FULL_45_11]
MNIVGEYRANFFSADAYQAGEFTKISLDDYTGKWVVLFFYPRDFTFVCPTEIREFAKLEPEFEKLNCSILACSTDSMHSHKNWFEKDLPEVKYPVLADTTQEIARSYSVLDSDGAAQRGTFVIDPEGIVRWMMISDNSVGRSVQEVLRAVQALQTGELCPAEWHEGDATLGK